MKIISSHEKRFRQALADVCDRAAPQTAKIEAGVKGIVRDVERNGDAAVARYVKKFDGLSLSPKRFRVSSREMRQAYADVHPKDRQALKFAARRIRAFHHNQRVSSWMHEENGVKLGQRITPLNAFPSGCTSPAEKRCIPPRC